MYTTVAGLSLVNPKEIFVWLIYCRQNSNNHIATPTVGLLEYVGL
jgi:hypothetical protein